MESCQGLENHDGQHVTEDGVLFPDLEPDEPGRRY